MVPGAELRLSTLIISLCFHLSCATSAPSYNTEPASSSASSWFQGGGEHSSLVPINLWPLRLPNKGRKGETDSWFLGTELRPLIYFSLFVKQQLMTLVHYPPGLDSGEVAWVESQENTVRAWANTLFCLGCNSSSLRFKRLGKPEKHLLWSY